MTHAELRHARRAVTAVALMSAAFTTSFVGQSALAASKKKPNAKHRVTARTTRPATAASTAAPTTASTLDSPTTNATGASPTASSATTASSAAAGVAKVFTGPPLDADRWGPVQVQIVVSAHKIVDVKVPVFPHTKSRSAEINNRALPLYKAEALAAQSGEIDAVSGATDTWSGYALSLQGAVDEARAKGLL